jgi:hypothetical protein
MATAILLFSINSWNTRSLQQQQQHRHLLDVSDASLCRSVPTTLKCPRVLLMQLGGALNFSSSAFKSIAKRRIFPADAADNKEENPQEAVQEYFMSFICKAS